MPVPSSWEKKERVMSDPAIKTRIQMKEAAGSGRMVKWGTFPLGAIVICATILKKSE